MNTSAQPIRDPKLDRLSLVASIPFFLTHIAMLGAFFMEFHWQYVVLCVVSYYVRMFGVTAGYHRYFSHRAYKTNRVFQFILAWLAQSSVQKGVLWWAANHRHHHRYSDQPEDIHSPTLRGFWWSHVGWILSSRYDKTNFAGIKDFGRFPELVWLNKYHLLPALSGAVVLYLVGGMPVLMWAGVIPTVLLWHGTFFINSLTHIFGSTRYMTTDTSKNNLVLALITCGEGWHNNHHYHQNTANQGWFWWEVDFSFYALKALSWLGVVSDLRMPSDATKYAYKTYTQAQREELAKRPWFSRPGRGAIPTPVETPVSLQPQPVGAK